MDALNNAYNQVADLFRSMTPGARITAGLLLAVVVASLAILFGRPMAGADTYLLGGAAFSSSELSAMEAAFGKAGLNQYTIEANRVRVPRGSQAAYLGALADAGAMPLHFGEILTKAASEGGAFVSKQQRDEIIKIARQRELALIVRSMRGIEDAFVHYDVQKRPGFRQETVTTASVSIKPVGTQPIDPSRVPMIRHLVAGAIAGLAPENIAVVDLNGRSYPVGTADGPGSSTDDPYLTRMKEYQTEYEAKIYTALAYVPGVTVTANVELDREMVQRRESVQIDPKAVVLRGRDDSRSTSSESTGPAGRPGLEAQRPNQGANLSAAGRGTRSQDESTTSEFESITSHERATTEIAGLTPRRVTVSVGVPSHYYEQLWQERNPTPPGESPPRPDTAALAQIESEESAKIRNHVAAMLPRPDATADLASLVTVTTFARVPPAEIPATPVYERALAWLGAYWSTLGILALAGVSLLMLRSLVRTSAQPLPESTLPPPMLASETPSAESPVDTAKAKSSLRRRPIGGPSLKHELAEIVRDDPDAAANILRSWIGNPG